MDASIDGIVEGDHGLLVVYCPAGRCFWQARRSHNGGCLGRVEDPEQIHLENFSRLSVSAWQHDNTLATRSLPTPAPAGQDILPRACTPPWPMEAVAG